MITTFDQLIDSLKGYHSKVIAVAYAHDTDALEAISKTHQAGIARGILVGPKDKIEKAAASVGLSLAPFEIVDIDDEKAATRQAVTLVREGQADVLMKGLCSTSTILSAVLDKQTGLRDAKLLSHVAAFQIPSYPKLIILSDAAMNIAPDLDEKVAITENAIQTANRLGNPCPKVAINAAEEKVTPTGMPCTADAAISATMGSRGQINNALVDGPLAVDNAFSKHSCEVKGISSPVGGDADIAITPNIETGNCFYKVMSYLALAKTAGIIVGARKPIVLTSRSDSDETKFLSIALAMKVS